MHIDSNDDSRASAAKCALRQFAALVRQELDFIVAVFIACGLVSFATWLILSSGGPVSGVSKIGGLGLSAFLRDSYPVNTHFNIDIIYTTPMTDEQKAYFEDAKLAWGRVFAGGFGSEVKASKGAPLCSHEPLTEDLIVRGLVVFVSILPIDGQGGILGQAGPCAYDKAGHVRAGLMRFDIDDLDNHFKATVRHEMGHVFGLGSSWEDRKLLSPDGVSPVTYSGSNGNLGHREVGGSGDAAVVEDEGGHGTARSHWKESSYPGEIMTGYLSKEGVQPISRLTVRALADLGFNVDVNMADDYVAVNNGASSSRRRLREVPVLGSGIQLKDDVYRGPFIVLS